MKKLFSALLVVFACALYAADTGMLSCAPEKYELLALADIQKILALPDVQKQLADPTVVKELADLKEVGITPEAFKSLLLFRWDDKMGGALRVSSAEQLRAALDKSITSGNGTSVAARDVNGRRIYRISNRKKADSDLDLTFVSDDVLVFSEDIDAYIAAAKLSAQDAAKISVADTEVWACWRNLDPPPAKPDPDNPNIRAVMATLNFAGETKHDLDIRAVGVFGDEKAAAKIGMMVPGWMSLGVGMAFGDDPKTGEKLIQALKCDVEGNTVRISVYLTEEILQKLSAFAEAAVKDAGKDDAGEAKTAPAAPTAPAESVKRNDN